MLNVLGYLARKDIRIHHVAGYWIAMTFPLADLSQFVWRLIELDNLSSFFELLSIVVVLLAAVVPWVKLARGVEYFSQTTCSIYSFFVGISSLSFYLIMRPYNHVSASLIYSFMVIAFQMAIVYLFLLAGYFREIRNS